MAKAKKTSSKASSRSDATVVRISASDDTPAKKKTEPKKSEKAVKATKAKKTTSDSKPKKRGFIRAFFGYFKGAWQELKLVRWPTRRATWGLTFAVLAFSAFFVIFILLVDAGFKYLFEIMYKK